ncbi:MAG: hypothetical protein PHE00_05655 [Atribacterota bacterium]|nr:hypothetical protein [Atribacterota bacterium]
MKKTFIMVFSVLVLVLLFAGCSNIANIIVPETVEEELIKGTPVDPDDPALVMYANDWEAGPIVPVNFAPYTAATHPARLNPANALGPFDAVQSPPTADPTFNPNEYFFGLAAREWTHYTFGEEFANIAVYPDILFSEVTWGSGWHVEAALVYLTNATVHGYDGYYPDNDGGFGYYAGIVWNKVGIQSVSAAQRLAITESYFGGTRDFQNNTFVQDGNFGISQFHLPDEVIRAEGIVLVDITKDVFNLAGGQYTSPTGYQVTLDAGYIPQQGVEITSADVAAVYGYVGNTDGYDLDAIRVYRPAPCYNETATGLGNRIIEKKNGGGSWFMYNWYPCGLEEIDDSKSWASEYTCNPYLIQLGNPKNGTNIIGTFQIDISAVDDEGNPVSSGWYVATYDLDDFVAIGRWELWINIMDEHLSISDDMDFQAGPGLDDNADWGVPFYDEDGEFFIFAHFGIALW